MNRQLLIFGIALTITASAHSQTFTNAPWVYMLNTSNEVVILGYTGAGGSVAIPTSLAGLPVAKLGGQLPPIFGFANRSVVNVEIPEGVKEIGNDAFFSAAGLTRVVIPNSVRSIGIGAFARCTNVTNFHMGTGVTNIGNGAFEQCYGVQDVVFGAGVEAIGNNAFASCTGLTNVVFSDSVRSIGVAAFRGCNSLTNVSVPNTVQLIDFNAFSLCTNLAKADIGAASVGDAAFAGCSSLAHLQLGNGVQFINISAFRSCVGLVSVVFPASISSIGGGSFQECVNLQSVLFLGDAPTVFGPDFSSATVYRLASSSGYGATLGGRPVQIFAPVAGTPSYSTAGGFQWSWSNTGAIPLVVQRTTSLLNTWISVSTNIVNGSYYDPTPPVGRAFYRAVVP